MLKWCNEMELFDVRIQSDEKKMLNLGCGTHYHNDWINVDMNPIDSSIIKCDLRQGIPFPDNYCDVIYSSHILEHFPRNIAQRFINECYRVLKYGGICRIVTPDLEQMTNNYLNSLSKVQTDNEASILDYEECVLKLYDQAVRNFPGGDYRAIRHKRRELNIGLDKSIQNSKVSGRKFIEKITNTSLNKLKLVYPNNFKQFFLSKILTNEEYSYFQIGKFRLSGEIHYFIYDSYSLTKLMQKSQFKNILKQTSYESMIPHFKRYHLDQLDDGSNYKNDSLYLEGMKL